MRVIAITAGAVALGAMLAAGGAAAAAPASVTVTVGPELQAKAAKTLGQRDVDGLAADLRQAVERRVAKTGAYDGAQIVLELADAQPNRPTFKQLSDRPGLSYESFSIGGARIEGHAVMPDGKMVPLSFHYYEPDIRYARLGGTWADAEWAIDRVAFDLGKGRAPNGR